ncbi:hypothetical protein ACS0TY_005236 [Phlomoides rotata]
MNLEAEAGGFHERDWIRPFSVSILPSAGHEEDYGRLPLVERLKAGDRRNSSSYGDRWLRKEGEESWGYEGVIAGGNDRKYGAANYGNDTFNYQIARHGKSQGAADFLGV